MVRVKRGNIAAKRRKKYLKLAKGYVGSNSRLSTMVGEQVVQGLNFAYIGIRMRQNIYSNFIGCLRKMNIFLNRKILSFLAFHDLPTFNTLERYSKVPLNS